MLLLWNTVVYCTSASSCFIGIQKPSTNWSLNNEALLEVDYSLSERTSFKIYFVSSLALKPILPSYRLRCSVNDLKCRLTILLSADGNTTAIRFTGHCKGADYHIIPRVRSETNQRYRRFIGACCNQRKASTVLSDVVNVKSLRSA